MIHTEESIFEQAIQLENPHECATFLDEACANQPALRQKIESLLKAYSKGTFLESPVFGVNETIDMPRIQERPGSQIGRYKLLEQIGEGGMGIVYMAEQTEPVRRRVALKVVKPGMDTLQVLARFEAERQAIALMDHPNIARVHDGGSTETGRPFFVMELVRGMPITEYCDQVKLAPRKRLELFISVCQAVAHAHQKGIIHRDIKPSNVLVTLHDGIPVPKVIDFGVAKAINQQLTEKTLFTGFGQILGTPLYMSPEQAEISGLDVDTRSDVYSLGVLLYELLTGQTPFDKDTLSKAGFDEMRRIIREDEPLRPSQRVRTVNAQALSTISLQRGIDQRRLGQLLQGELDWIVMKALEKDRNRRYESANALAADVQRYLDNEAVEAFPPSSAYRLKKLARRHKVAIITTGLVALALVCGIMISVWQAVEAFQARGRADANFQLARQAVDETITKIEQEPRLQESDFVELRKSLLAGVVPLLAELGRQKTDDPRLEADRGVTLRRLAQLQTTTGNYVAARTDCEQARTLFLQLSGMDPARSSYRDELAVTHTLLADILVKLQDNTAAEVEFHAAIQLLVSLLSDSPRDAALREHLSAAHSSYGVLLSNPGRNSDAEIHYRASEAIEESLVAEFPDVTKYQLNLAGVHVSLGNLYGSRRDYATAENETRQGIVLAERLMENPKKLPTYGRALASLQLNLGWLLLEQGKFTEAETALRQAVTVAQQLTQDFPTIVENYRVHAAVHSKLGVLLATTGNLPEAQIAFQAALEIRNAMAEKSPADRAELAESHYSVARVLQATGNHSDSLKEFRAALAISAEFPQMITSRVTQFNAHLSVSRILMELGNHAEAEVEARAGVSIAAGLAAEFPHETQYQEYAIKSRDELGRIFLRMRRYPEAEQEVRTAISLGDALLSQSANSADYRGIISDCHYDLAEILIGSGKHEDAEKEFRLALDMKEAMTAGAPEVPEYRLVEAGLHLTFAIFLDKTPGKDDEAQIEYDRALEMFGSLASEFPTESVYRHRLYRAHYEAGRRLSRLGKDAGAIAAYRSAMQAYEAMQVTLSEDVQSGSDIYNAACVCSLASQPLDGEAGQLEELAIRAVTLLKKARDSGWDNLAHIMNDADLNPIRERQDFKEFVGTLKAAP